jgi:DNA-binding NarL/FixJ family response regulator
MFDVPGSKLTGDGGPAVSSNVERRTSNFERPQEPARIRVLLVDDHAMMRQGLRALLDGHAEIDLAGEAADGEEAVALAGTLRPAVVVMDINMPKKNGIDATAEMKALYPDVTVIGLSVNADDDNRTAMLKAGAMMLLTKEAAVEHLYGAIQQAVKRR